MVQQPLQRRFGRALGFCALLSIGASGCVRGYLYQDIVVPYAINMNRTPVGDLSGSASSYGLKEPFTGANISVEWNSYGLADASRQGGVEDIFIADLRRQSAAFGIWRRDTLIVNGRRFEIQEGALEPLPLPLSVD